MKGQSQEILQEDMKALKSTFSSTLNSKDNPPKCHVLFLYGKIGKEDGRIENTKLSLREIIRESGAQIVIVASENESDGYILASKKVGYGNANLVMTLQRNGINFTAFFIKLFEDMMHGTAMPIAWVKLVPQIPGKARPNDPSLIFVCEAGQISFK